MAIFDLVIHSRLRRTYPISKLDEDKVAKLRRGMLGYANRRHVFVELQPFMIFGKFEQGNLLRVGQRATRSYAAPTRCSAASFTSVSTCGSNLTKLARNMSTSFFAVAS